MSPNLKKKELFESLGKPIKRKANSHAHFFVCGCQGLVKENKEVTLSL